jgi:hypothetical protein
MITFRIKKVGKLLAEREGSESPHDKWVTGDISENTPENTSKMLTLFFFINGNGTESLAARIRDPPTEYRSSETVKPTTPTA